MVKFQYGKDWISLNYVKTKQKLSQFASFIHVLNYPEFQLISANRALLGWEWSLFALSNMVALSHVTTELLNAANMMEELNFT